MHEFRILLVEDEAPKQRHICQCLSQIDSNFRVHIARSVNSALDAVEQELPDLVLLDMSLPTFDIGDGEAGGHPQGFGGIEILRHMTLLGLFLPTIVVTGYEAFPKEGGGMVGLPQLREELSHDFPTIFRGILHYNSTYDEWKIALQSAISSITTKNGSTK